MVGPYLRYYIGLVLNMTFGGASFRCKSSMHVLLAVFLQSVFPFIKLPFILFSVTEHQRLLRCEIKTDRSVILADAVVALLRQWIIATYYVQCSGQGFVFHIRAGI